MVIIVVGNCVVDAVVGKSVVEVGIWVLVGILVEEGFGNFVVISVVGNCVIENVVGKSLVEGGIWVLVGITMEEVIGLSVVIFLIGIFVVDIFVVGSCVVDAFVCNSVVEVGIWVEEVIDNSVVFFIFDNCVADVVCKAVYDFGFCVLLDTCSFDITGNSVLTFLVGNCLVVIFALGYAVKYVFGNFVITLLYLIIGNFAVDADFCESVGI